MPSGFQFGVDQFSIHRDFEAAAIRRDKRDALDHMLELLEQVISQAHGPVGVVSDRTVNDLDLKHGPSRLASRRALCNFALFQPSGRLQTLENYNMQRLGLCVGTGERYNPLTVPSPMQGESNANLRLPL